MTTIADTYRLTKKEPDIAWNLYVCRPVAAVIVHALRFSRVTPNQITLAAFGVALVSGGMLLALPGNPGLCAAVLVFELSYVLDCADGMLARYRGTQSTEGHLFDFLMDELKAFLILGAASVRLFREHGQDARFLLGGLFGMVALASGIALTTFVRRPEIEGPATAPGRARTSLLGLVERAAKFVIHYPSHIWIAAAFGRLEIYFYPYVAVNALYAVRTFASVAVRFGRK